MKRIIAAALLSICLSTQAYSDERTVIQIPPDIKALFLEEMRTHLDNLNEITMALSAGDFDGAAYVAENKMGFGHSAREVMMERGMSEDEINIRLERMRKNHGQGMGKGMGRGAGMGGMGLGMGRYMPDEAREMGQMFHQAAENLANVAKGVNEAPTVEEYQKVFTALSEVVDICSACHSSFKVE